LCRGSGCAGGGGSTADGWPGARESEKKRNNQTPKGISKEDEKMTVGLFFFFFVFYFFFFFFYFYNFCFIFYLSIYFIYIFLQ